MVFTLHKDPKGPLIQERRRNLLVLYSLVLIQEQDSLLPRSDTVFPEETVWTRRGSDRVK